MSDFHSTRVGPLPHAGRPTRRPDGAGERAPDDQAAAGLAMGCFVLGAFIGYKATLGIYIELRYVHAADVLRGLAVFAVFAVAGALQLPAVRARLLGRRPSASPRPSPDEGAAPPPLTLHRPAARARRPRLLRRDLDADDRR